MIPVQAILQLHLDVPSNTACSAFSTSSSCAGPVVRLNDVLYIWFHIDAVIVTLDIFRYKYRANSKHVGFEERKFSGNATTCSIQRKGLD